MERAAIVVEKAEIPRQVATAPTPFARIYIVWSDPVARQTWQEPPNKEGRREHKGVSQVDIVPVNFCIRMDEVCVRLQPTLHILLWEIDSSVCVRVG